MDIISIIIYIVLVFGSGYWFYRILKGKIGAENLDWKVYAIIAFASLYSPHFVLNVLAAVIQLAQWILL